ncbi:L-arabinonolactonase [Duganella sp. CF458]|uniref:SMP-30/gluconolactonase/LRE family protein n=1 Tax=Duganella sp. CF458 TaxID=1884368 RepID=UPI0008F321A7|nr:SMP-30/gluconolactonase/LRE family protein [Duganella sp. CF458]SFG12909.1 L-arabinonolactonase [Duganella sp. CF458]
MELIVDAQNALGECIVWCGRTQALLWTDILGRKLWRHRPSSGETRQWDMPERLASFALTAAEGRLLLGLESRLAWFDLATGEAMTIVEVEADVAATRINDGRCDRQGRFVFGTMNEAIGRAPVGRFYRLGHNRQLELLPLSPVAIANSICFSPDGATMYFCDSLSGLIRCCDYGDDVSGERIFAHLPPGCGEPDGSVVDADGFLWNAEWGASRIVRYRPDGSVERAVAVPVSQPTCPVFGGPDLNQLFVTSALVDLLESERYAGGVFGMPVTDAVGLPEVRFGAKMGDDSAI